MKNKHLKIEPGKKSVKCIAILLFLILLLNDKSVSQNKIDNVLAEISKNNKTLIANKEFIKAKGFEFKTGLYLTNPFIEFSNLFGTTADDGNQTEFKLLQSFDFPSVYSRKRNLSNLRIQQTKYEREVLRQDLLLEAKQTCLELIYLNKRSAVLKRKFENSRFIYELYSGKLNMGEGNILDVNKAKINMLNVKTDIQLNEIEINNLNVKLTGLNGGVTITFSDTTYPIIPSLPEFVTLENTIEINDPLKKYLEQEILINKSLVEVSKSLNLPRFELGYYYQGIGSQKYNGFQLGFSIPLWENKYKTDFYSSKVLYSSLEIESHKNEHYYEIKKLYEKQNSLNESLIEYQIALQTSDNNEILLRALNVGELSLIEYLMETGFFFSSYDIYLEIEKEFQKIIAELYKYRL
ncbi:MAG: TolC family protein [Bacteroidota bacterium]|nr:TolC family protein [Bacteroidota bacterium]